MEVTCTHGSAVAESGESLTGGDMLLRVLRDDDAPSPGGASATSPSKYSPRSMSTEPATSVGNNTPRSMNMEPPLQKRRTLHSQKSKFIMAIEGGEVVEYKEEPRECGGFMLPPEGELRVVWDLLMLVCVGYVSLVLPYRLAFDVQPEKGTWIWFLEATIDGSFLCDVALNFRTGYYDGDGTLVMDGPRVAAHYLRSWFVLDVVSSVPLDALFGKAFSHLNAAKLLKIGKIMKVIKLLRLSKFNSRSTTLMDILDEFFMSKSALVVASTARMALSCLLLCHLLACFMVLSGPGFLRNYPGHDDRAPASKWGIEARYLTAMYFAMSTMTTVGYGDVIPDSSSERLYAMFAMCVGGGFYGYVVGVMARLVAVRDANDQATSERLCAVHAWLAHYAFPLDLHRRVRRHFKRSFSERTALDERRILGGLDDDLREEVLHHLVPGPIRRCYLLATMDPGIVLALSSALRPTAANADEVVARQGDAGNAMYVLAGGACIAEASLADDCAPEDHHHHHRIPHARRRVVAARASQPAAFTPQSKKPRAPNRSARVYLDEGETFGELVALTVHAVYHATLTCCVATPFYTVTSHGIHAALGRDPVLFDLRHMAVAKAASAGFLDPAEADRFGADRASRGPAEEPPVAAAASRAILAAVARLSDDLSEVRADLARANARLAKLDSAGERPGPATGA